MKTKEKQDTPLIKGLTMIELIVVILITGILVSLVMPAVQSAREAARRANCINNLKQFGIGVNLHAEMSGKFPSAISSGGFSPHTILLPHFSQLSTYNSINFAGETGWVGNVTAAKAAIEVFHCPSDTAGAGNDGERISYAGNRGVGVQKYGYNGAFALANPVALRDITDGLSNTVAFAEWLSNASPSNDVRRPTFATPEELSSAGQLDAFAVKCRAIDFKSASAIFPGKGEKWIQGEFSYTLYNHTLPPNSRSCTNGNRVQQGAWTAGSLHLGGVNVLFADGHVRFERNTIDLEVWRAMGSRAGGEVFNTSAR